MSRDGVFGQYRRHDLETGRGSTNKGSVKREEGRSLDPRKRTNDGETTLEDRVACPKVDRLKERRTWY